MILTWSLLLAGAGAMLFFINRHKKNQICTAIRITIENSNDNHFIDSVTVITSIQSVPVIGEKLSAIDAGKLEALLENDPHIRNAEVYKELDGTVHLKVWQKKALLRIVNNAGESYYIDDENYKMPASNNFTPRVLVCSGNITEQYTKCDTASSFTVKTCTSIAHFVHNSSFWSSMIEQIFVTADNTIMLIPKMGEAKIVFGSVSSDGQDVEDKFNRLYSFYKQALPKAGWDKYKLIDVSYKKQIVAKK